MKTSLKKTSCALVLGLTAMTALAACGGNPASSASTTSNSGSASSSSDAPKTYTYRDAMTESPETWNPHTWQTNTDSVIMDYTTIGLYDFVYDKDTDGYKAIPEMAASEAVDDTANLTEDDVEKYGLSKNGSDLYTKGQKWVVDLNKNAAWDDGTAITADDYIYSMQQMINPQMQNYRSSSFATGTASFGNADNYLKSGSTTYEWMAGYKGANRSGSDYYFALYGTLYGTNIFNKDAYNKYTPGYIGAYYAEKGTDDEKKTYATLIKMAADSDTYGTAEKPIYVAITDANQADIIEAYAEFLYFFYDSTQVVNADRTAPGNNAWNVGDFDYVKTVNPVTDWANVGLVKSGDYQLTFYLVNPLSTFQFHYNFASNWLVKKDLYEAGKKTVGSLVTTTYGTSADTYASYGPYKLAAYQLDKDISITRNAKWYGYTDGKHANQYQIDAFDIQIVASEDTILEMFLKGQLDSYGLRSQDMPKLGGSSRLLYTPQSNTTKMTFNSNFDLLKTEQDTRNTANNTSYNHTILENVNFRKGLSLGMDRSTLVQTQTAGSQAFDVPINNMYVSDPNTGKLYRDTDQAKKVVTDNFGVDSDGEPNYVAYDLTSARKLIDTAVDEEVALNAKYPGQGYYNGTDTVELYWEVYNDGWATMVTFIKDQFTKIFTGTKLEGKVVVNTVYNLDYSDDIKAGKCDLAMSTWGGAEFDPYSIPEVYISEDYKYEPGIVSSTSLTLKPDGKTEVTHTLKEWYVALQSGDYSEANATTDVRVTVLAGLENWLVSSYNFMSLYARSSASLNSYRVKQATNTYHQLVGYGGIRFLTLTQDDAAWNTYVSGHLVNGELPYGND